MGDRVKINSGNSTAGTALLPFRFVARSGTEIIYTANKSTRSIGATRREFAADDEAEYAYDGRTKLEVSPAAAIAVDDFIMPGANGIGALHDGLDGSVYGARALEAVALDASPGATVTIEVEILPGYAAVVPA